MTFQYQIGNVNVVVSLYCQDIHKELEEKIARFHGREDAILYISCFDANAGIFEVLLSPDDAIISDELNHASIIDGIRLCKAQRQRYKHRDMEGYNLFHICLQFPFFFCCACAQG